MVLNDQKEWGEKFDTINKRQKTKIKHNNKHCTTGTHTRTQMLAHKRHALLIVDLSMYSI